jgi:biopolymer transport protein TolR
MSMSTGGGDKGSLSEINVTPLVDVMLVLLIIFMVTTPMMSQGIPVQLPQASQQSIDMNMDESTILTIAKDGTVYLDDRPIPADRLEFQLRRLHGELAVRNLFLRGDRRVPYGEVVRVLDMMKRVGLTKVGMVTEVYEGP